MFDFTLAQHELFGATVAAAVLGGLFNAAMFRVADRRLADLRTEAARIADLLRLLDREGMAQRAATKELAFAADRLRTAIQETAPGHCL